jgi:uncharacterized repeat protein (TIGR01451 family)/fimbrial isopeptide formation D2 family protein
MRYRMIVLAVVTCLASLTVFALPRPDVNLPAPQRNALIGDTVTFCVLFRNNQGAVGYGPFLDLVFDQEGAGGISSNSPCDGVTFVKAEMVGTTPAVPLTPTAPVTSLAPCGSNTAATHPLASSTVSWPSLVPLTAPQLVTLELPFGSFDQTQPAIMVEVTARIHKWADDGKPLNVYVRGGFRYGATPLNEISDPPVLDPLNPSAPLSAWHIETITPHAVILEKRFLGAENETVPGPNFPDKYEIKVNVAPGQTITGLVLSDCGSADVNFTSVTSVAGGVISVLPSNCFQVQYPSLLGPASGPADTLTAHFDITNALPIVAPNCSARVGNTITAIAGSWTPLDSFDLPVSPVVASATARIQKKNISLVETAAINGSGLAIPPNVVTYTLKFRISDFEKFKDLVIEDTISDGLAFVPLSATYNVRDDTHSASGNFSPGFLSTTKGVKDTYTCPPDPNAPPCMASQSGGAVVLAGGTHLTFKLSQAITGSFPGGIMTGGGSSGGAIGTIVFQAAISPSFSFGPHSSLDIDRNLDKDDPLLSHATITGTFVFKGTPPKCSDESNVCLIVPSGTFIKEIVATNGTSYLTQIPNPIGGPRLTRGDPVTYRLTRTIPSGNAEKLTFKDWLPRPVLDVGGIPAGPVSVCGLAPPATVCYRMTPVNLVTPTLTVSPQTVENSLTFDFGNLDFPPNTQETIVIEITSTITNDPFADGLFLTNEAQECEWNSYGAGPFCQTAIAQFQLGEPSLRIRKGILCASGTCPDPHPDPSPIEDTPTANPNARQIGPIELIDPNVTKKPVAICALPAPCPRFTGRINSNTLPGFISTSSQADAGDRVTFIVTIENAGNGPQGAWNVALKDVLPAGMTYVTGSLCVTYGDGSPLATSGSFPASLSLNDPTSGTVGALAPFSPGSGLNIAVLTFDATIGPPSQVPIGSCLTNHAELTSYSNMPNGSNFVTAGFTPPFFADANVCITPKVMEKRILSTSESHTAMTPTVKLAIGEIVRYSLRVQIPEGSATNFQIVDLLPPGLQFITPPAATVSTSGFNTAFPVTMTPPASGSTGPITFSFGNIVNNDHDADCEFLTVIFDALVLNTSVNNNTSLPKSNLFQVKVNGVVIATSPSVDAVIVEPHITPAKSVMPAVVSPGGTVTYTITLTSNGSSDAFDVALTDIFPASTLAGLTASAPVMSPAGCATFTAPVFTSTTMTSGTPPLLPKMPVGCTATFTITGHLLPGLCPAPVINRAGVTYTSLPGLKGTAANATGATVPGNPGAVDGERIYNDFASASFSCIKPPPCDFSITKTGVAGKTGAGDMVTYTITANVTPTGMDCPACMPIQIVDMLPPELVKVTVTVPPFWTQTLTGSQLVLSTTKQPPPMPAVFTVTGFVSPMPPSKTLTNCVRILCNDANPQNDSSCVTVVLP